nr:hypothetical protein [Tanacetum cinerariifolium]
MNGGSVKSFLVKWLTCLFNKMVRRLRWSQWFGDDDGSGSGCHGEDGGGGWRVWESGMVDLIGRETGIVSGFAENARRKIFPAVVGGGGRR